MTGRFYCFNGDADGLCALQQLRLTESGQAQFVTGVKHDTALLRHLEGEQEAHITMLDVSVDRNKDHIGPLLSDGCQIRWFDHHVSKFVPKHEHFDNHIDTDAAINTSQIVNRFLEGAFPLWAIVGLFGDNMHATAEELGQDLGVSKEDLQRLRMLGELLNYNSYGEEVDDLFFHPLDIALRLAPFDNPLDFMDQDDLTPALHEHFSKDVKAARAARRIDGMIYMLPLEPWSRRVVGVWINKLARDEPQSPHAALVEKADGSFHVSVRAPLTAPSGADELCRMFPSGGGRAGAAGIRTLPKSDMAAFVDRFHRQFGTQRKDT